MDKPHAGPRDAMRVVGPTMVVVGIVMFLSLVLQMGGRSMPNPIWGFLGVFLIGIGAAITRWAWLGPAATYAAQETAPAVAIATRAVLGEIRRPGPACAACRAENAPDARYCKACGRSLARACAACGGTSAADARFCDDCGKPLPS